ncbi:MAG: hypothetical protein IT364_16510 [Candidatus Hydrogenedentes bacterium]|nr:hypothetical protein [Candidatus Hydrogenedentota bacterium]
MLARTGLTIADHQRLTIERYDELLTHDRGGVYIMPVPQGYAPMCGAIRIACVAPEIVGAIADNSC